MRRVCSLAVMHLLAIACAGGEPPTGDGRGSGRGGERGGAPPSAAGRQAPAAAVPVEVADVVRTSISTYIETNGALEAENEVDIVARVSGQLIELRAEEGMAVQKGQLLARIDDEAIRADQEAARVQLRDAELVYERARRLRASDLVSVQDYDQALAAFDSARAQVLSNEIQLRYARIEAPFSGRIVRRYVDFAEQLSVNTPVFRLSDFDPLLCAVQVPERDLRKLSVGQPGYVTVESWPEEPFEARVLRVSPIVDAATGTIKVTLKVDASDRLRPGMFASVFIETDTRADALVIPRKALALDAINDTVYVATDGIAERREVELGYREGDMIEVASGLEAGERVVVVGQDGLTDGTPIQVFRDEVETATVPDRDRQAGGETARP